MLNKSRFQSTLERAQLKIAQSVNLSIEKLDTYWEEFKDSGITDPQFEDCVKAVSRQSRFFPKVSEIWEEILKLRRANLTPRIEQVAIIRRTPKPSGFEALVAQERTSQKERQDKLNGGKYLGSSAY